MSRQIFVNLPVRDLDKTKAFFSSLGFGFNQQFTNEQAACMVISEDHSYVMLLVEDFFKSFIRKSLADAHQSTEVLLCLSCDSRAEVDEMVAKAIAGGGKASKEAKDHGFMYEHGFEDLDGHLWEVMHMDMSAAPPQF
ncbi:MAG: glyoxalase/bleomycin resistance/extradiol dioxygenase family protein [Leptothrix sp. (in: Bacteria)]|nr:glyoxalase/bleomycin resistance/extradiol dioxygenase family protein [Leptothrix sp. (in: b-proteobacteria)]